MRRTLVVVLLLAACGKNSNGTTTCGDTQSDAENCGTCGNVCNPGDACTAGICAPATSYITLSGTATDHPTMALGTAPRLAAGAQITLVDPLVQLQYPDDLNKAILKTKLGKPAVDLVKSDGTWSFADVDVTNVLIGVVAILEDAPGAAQPRFFPNGTGVTPKLSPWTNVTGAHAYGLPMTRVLELDKMLKLTGGNALEKVGFVYGWAADRDLRPINGAKITAATNQSLIVYYPDALIAGEAHNAAAATAWHGLFLIPSAGAADDYTATVGAQSFGPNKAGSAPKKAFSAVITSPTMTFVDPKVTLSGMVNTSGSSLVLTSGAGLSVTLENAADGAILANTTTPSDGTWTFTAQDVSKVNELALFLIHGPTLTDTLVPFGQGRPTLNQKDVLLQATPASLTQKLDQQLNLAAGTLETSGYVRGMVSGLNSAQNVTVVTVSGATIAGTAYPKMDGSSGDNGRIDAGGAFVIPGSSGVTGSLLQLVARAASGATVASGTVKIEAGKATVVTLATP